MAVTSGYGTLLKRGDGGSPESFTTLANIVSVSGPNETLEALDATHMESTGAAKEFIGGLIDGGEVSAQLRYDPNHATHQNLKADLVSRVLRNFQVYFPVSGGKTASFAALVTGVSRESEVSGQLMTTVTLKISGLVTIA